MFETLRRMIIPIIVTVLLFFTAMIVLEWGLGFSRRQSFVEANVAAVINGEEISWQTYNQLYNSLYQIESQKTEGELSDKKVKELQQKAWKQLLHDKLIMQQAAKNHIIATPDEIYSFLRFNPPPELQQVPYFQTDGKFDYQKYFNAMADPQAATFWASIEPYARESVIKQKMQERVVMTAVVTEAEIKEFYLAENEKIKVGMVNVSFDRFSRPPPRSTEEELKEFFEEHKDEYTIDERAALNIALIEKKPSPRDWEVAYDKAMAIYDSIQNGADFAEMARRYSDDVTSAKEGGNLGWFQRGQMVEEFDKRVFSMQEGQVAKPIRTQFGWHIIKLHGFKEEMDRPRGKVEKELVKKANASHILIKVEPSQETLDAAYRRLEEFQIAARKSGFFKAGEDLNLPIKRTGFFFRNKNIQYIGFDPAANKFAFEAEIDEISEVMENNSAFFVIQVAERRPAGMATFEDAKEKVKLDIVEYKVRKLCQDTAQAIYEEIMKGTDIEKAAKMHGEEYEIPEPFTRKSYVRGLARDPAAMGAAFSLTEPGQVSKPIDYKQGTVIFKLLERPSLDLTDYNAKRDSIYTKILNAKREMLYSNWVDKLIEDSEIENNIEKMLEETRAY
jgi:parvulin-like peptidyl-prolyl isomerase